MLFQFKTFLAFFEMLSGEKKKKAGRLNPAQDK